MRHKQVQVYNLNQTVLVIECFKNLMVQVINLNPQQIINTP